MLKGFKTKELIFLTLMGVLMFLIDFSISSGIDAASGISGIGYIVSGFIFVGLGVFAALVVRRFFSITILGLIYGVLAIPTPIFGPPGFYKIIIGLSVGIIADLIVFLFRYKKLGYYLSFTIGNLLTLPIWIFVLISFGLPGVDAVIKIIWLVIGVYFIQGLFGAWIGFKLYNKIKNKKIIKQISG